MKEVINEIFDKVISNVSCSFPSVYSKEDVITVIGRIKLELMDLDFYENKDEERIEQQVLAICNSLEVEMHRGNFVDLESASFSIDHNNQIQVDDIEIDVDAIISELSEIVTKVLSL